MIGLAKRAWMTLMICGIVAAAPAPCTNRAAMSTAGSGATQHSVWARPEQRGQQDSFAAWLPAVCGVDTSLNTLPAACADQCFDRVGPETGLECLLACNNTTLNSDQGPAVLRDTNSHISSERGKTQQRVEPAPSRAALV